MFTNNIDSIKLTTIDPTINGIYTLMEPNNVLHKYIDSLLGSQCNAYLYSKNDRNFILIHKIIDEYIFRWSLHELIIDETATCTTDLMKTDIIDQSTCSVDIDSYYPTFTDKDIVSITLDYKLSDKLLLGGHAYTNRDYPTQRQISVKPNIIFKLKNMYFEFKYQDALGSFVQMIAVSIKDINTDNIECMKAHPRTGHIHVLLKDIIIRADSLKGDHKTTAIIIFYEQRSCETFINSIKYFKDMDIGFSTELLTRDSINKLIHSDVFKAIYDEHLSHIPIARMLKEWADNGLNKCLASACVGVVERVFKRNDANTRGIVAQEGDDSTNPLDTSTRIRVAAQQYKGKLKEATDACTRKACNFWRNIRSWFNDRDTPSDTPNEEGILMLTDQVYGIFVSEF